MNIEGRKSAAKISIGSIMLLAAVLLLALAGWWFVAVLPWEGSIDYSKKPAGEVFQAVTGSPVPHGVSDMRVAGRSFPLGIKHWVYIRFRANDAALEELLAKQDPVAGRYALDALNYPHAVSNRYDRADRKRVGWDELKTISQPEVYVVTGGRNPFVWYGYLILDRRNHVVFIGSNGD